MTLYAGTKIYVDYMSRLQPSTTKNITQFDDHRTVTLNQKDETAAKVSE